MADGRGWLRTDSLAFVAFAALLAMPLAYLWADRVLPPFNSNHLGCDSCHHAILIHCQSLPDRAERAFLADYLATYPQTAHWLAARWLPLLGGDPYKAMRATSFASLLIMLALQFALLRRVLPAGPAVLALLAWQLLCYFGNVANVHYFSKAYFFSQAVGMTAAWAALLIATWPAHSPRWRGLHTLLAAALAGLAYLCHLVPGVTALGGLGLYYLLGWWRTRAAADAARVALVGGVSLALVLGTGQLAHMAHSRLEFGDVPVKNWSLLLAWVPLLLLALFRHARRRTEGPQPPPAEGLVELLTCVLCVTGLIQAYCAAEFALGKAAPYSANKLFYVLFPLTTLLWLLVGAGRLGRLPSLRPWTVWPLRAAGVAVGAFLLVRNGRVFVANELLDENVAPERNPVLVARRLARETAADAPARSGGRLWRSDLVYFDPGLRQSSVFVNVVGLRRSWSDAEVVLAALHSWEPVTAPPTWLGPVRCRRLILPADLLAAGGSESVSRGPGR
jgi:hypothetical protein